MVFVGPPNTCSQTLAGCSYKRIAIFILFPRKATVPRCTYGLSWLPRICDFNFVEFSRNLFFLEFDEMCIALRSELQFFSILLNRFNLHGFLKINLKYFGFFQ